MSTIGNLANAINAQNVQLLIGTNTAITVYNIRHSTDLPVNRTNTRSGAIDFYSYPLIEVTFDATVSKDIYDALEALTILNSRGVLPNQAFSIIGQNISGNTLNDITTSFTANVRSLVGIAGPTGNYAVTCTLRILNSTWTSA